MKRRAKRMSKIIKRIAGESLVELVPQFPLYISEVQVSDDLRYGTLWVGSFKEISEEALLATIQPHTSLIQQRLANHLETKFTPKLRYRADTGSRHQAQINRILQDLQETEEE